MKYAIQLKLQITLFIFLLSFSNICAQSISKKEITDALTEAYEKYKDIDEGKNASYIKELASVPSDIFGIVIVTPNGKTYSIGDIETEISIQSISKAFVMAKVIEESGYETVLNKIGVNATGEPFNSIIAIEKNQGKKINSLVNPGAIATTSLILGNDYNSKWNNIKNTLSDFSGRKLELNEAVYISEAKDNLRNQAIAHLLLSYNRIYFDPVQTTDIYTKQCALNVTTKDLAIMAATLANGGLNPITKKQVVSPNTTKHTLAVLASAGLYDDAGTWLYKTGTPAKSGVGGGIVAIIPGKFGVAAIAPPLDKAGNSVKAQLAISYIIEKLKANPYLITPQK